MSAKPKDHFSWQPAIPYLEKIIWALVLVILLPIINGGLALAQNDTADQILGFIERNAELLEWSAEVVMESESVSARQVLREARLLHERSVELLNAERPLMALGVARRSRAALRRAVGLAREALSFEERLRLRSERFLDLQAHLLEQARESDDQQSLEFIRRAENQALRAREQYLQGNAKRAFKLLEQAEQLLHRAARLLADGVGPERLDREIARTQAQLDQTRELLGDDANPAALKLLAEAEEALDRARDHQDRGQPGRALQMSGLARKLAGRARAVQTVGPDADSVGQQLERWDQRAAAVADRVEASGSQPARRHLDLARQHRQRAQQALAEGEVEKALRQIRAAHDQLGQAEGLAR